jgi:hypothetical protein
LGLLLSFTLTLVATTTTTLPSTPPISLFNQLGRSSQKIIIFFLLLFYLSFWPNAVNCQAL